MSDARVPDYLKALDTSRVMHAVERAFGRSVVGAPQWWGERMGASLGVATGALVRLKGVARLDNGSDASWSFVVKVVRPPSGTRHEAGARDPRHWAYWRREPLAYQSGLLDDLPGGLAAPRCVLAEERAPDEVWLWLEDLPDVAGPDWPEPRYILAARHLGGFGGAYLGRRPLPRAPWLAHDLFRRRIALAEQEHNLALFWDDATWRHPLVVGRFPGEASAMMRRLWDARVALLDVLDRTPQTLCHGDTHRHNLRARQEPDGSDATVAIDWAALSVGPIGADLTDLAIGALTGPMEFRSPTLVDALYAAYLDGLRASGWRGEAGEARLGYAATMALAGATRLHWTLVTALDDGRRGTLGSGDSAVAGMLDAWATAVAVFADLGDEAINLVRRDRVV